MGKIKEKLQQNTVASRFAANTGWMLFDKIFHMALSLVTTGMVSRYLRPEQYGLLSYGLAFIEVFTILCKLGIDGIIVNELIKNKEKNGEIIGTTICLRLVSSLLSLLATWAFVVILNPGETVVLIITMIQSISLIMVAFDTIDYYFQSRLESKYTTIARSVAYPLVCALRIAFVLLKCRVEWFAWATVLDALVISVALLYFYKAKGGQKLSFSFGMVKYLLHHSYNFIPVSLLVTIYTQMDKIMVKSFSDSSQVGLYQAAMLIANLWIFIPNALVDSGRPLIMAMKAEGRQEEYEKRMKLLCGGVSWISILAGIGFTAFGWLAIRIVNGSDYMAAVPVLMILIWSRWFSQMGTIRSIWMLCEGMEKQIKWFIGMGALINVVLNALLIPRMGAVGAAVATLVTEVVSSFVATAIYPGTRHMAGLILQGMPVWKYIKK